MKKLFLFISLLFSLSAFSQGGRISWGDLYNTPYYRNGLRASMLALTSRNSLITTAPDTTVSFFYVKDDTIPILYAKGRNIPLNGGNIVNNNGGGSVTQDTKDTSITWAGNRTYVDIPSGITYNPVDNNVTLTSATSVEGDDGTGFSWVYTYSNQSIRIVYPFAPIGSFTYRIKFTKAQ